MLRMDLYISAGGKTKTQDGLGHCCKETSGMSPHIELCSLRGPEASVYSRLDWGMGGGLDCCPTDRLSSQAWCLTGAAGGDNSGDRMG